MKTKVYVLTAYDMDDFGEGVEVEVFATRGAVRDAETAWAVNRGWEPSQSALVDWIAAHEGSIHLNWDTYFVLVDINRELDAYAVVSALTTDAEH